MAGWIKPCPTDLGWLKPSEVITNQPIPSGGFQAPSTVISKWGVELLFSGIYLTGGVCMLIYSTKKRTPIVIMLSGIVICIAGWIFFRDGWRMSSFLLGMGGLLTVFGVYRVVIKKGIIQ